MNTPRRCVTQAAALAAAFVATSVVPAFAQLNAAQRHPTVTGIAAGAATHTALKISANRKKARHQRLNWAERHPTLTGIGAAVATHHMLKKSAAHKKAVMHH